ncbi:MAG: isochorismatase family protein [Dehalococcoidia bacterium]
MTDVILVTDICVMHTVPDARNRDYDVDIPIECVALSDIHAHHFAMGHIEKVLGATYFNHRSAFTSV